MLYKAIEFGKEKRKPYYGIKAKNKTCRNHGSDNWAVNNRVFFDKKARMAAEMQIEDFFNYIY